MSNVVAISCDLLGRQHDWREEYYGHRCAARSALKSNGRICVRQSTNKAIVMATIRIEWLTDSYDCETCGGSFAEGARVYIDGAIAIEMEPVAHCFGGANFAESDVFERILRHLGHALEINNNQ